MQITDNQYSSGEILISRSGEVYSSADIPSRRSDEVYSSADIPIRRSDDITFKMPDKIEYRLIACSRFRLMI
jgi:hypothetical protein